MAFLINSTQKKILGSLSFIAFFLFLCGCIETQETTDSDNLVHDNLLGTWSMSQEVENSSVKIIYTFYSNLSFFSGVQNVSSEVFDSQIWGTYFLNESRITFVVPEINSSTELKYSISDDGNNFLLYYEDEINFDILIRDQ
jgi:hypothetical protein